MSLCVCANCGKGEEVGSDLKACAACNLVKYCNRDCQIAHRSQHKKECKKRAAELHDEKLFKEPPQLDDCPICMIRLPMLIRARTYMTCCGKMICRGCVHAFQSRAITAGRQKEDDICPFCRTPPPPWFLNFDVETIKRYMKRMEMNDAQAFRNMGDYYAKGQYGLPQDMAKALELWHRAAELGNAEAHFNIGQVYRQGLGVQTDEKKAMHYYELAAMRGHAMARHNLGAMEARAVKMDRALKHWMIAVSCGSADSLNSIKQNHLRGYITKDDYARALRSYQAYVDEIKSDQRDEAAAIRDERYY